MTLSTGSSQDPHKHCVTICSAQDQGPFKCPQSNTNRIDYLKNLDFDVNDQEIISGSIFKENQEIKKKERVLEYKYFKIYL